MLRGVRSKSMCTIKKEEEANLGENHDIMFSKLTGKPSDLLRLLREALSFPGFDTFIPRI